MAGKTRCMAEDTAVSFAKHMDNYIKNSEVFKHSIVAAVQAAVLPLQKEISWVKDELAKLKSDLAEEKAKANNNEQFWRRNSLRIFGLNEEEGEDYYDKVLQLCENVLEIEVGRDEWDRVHRVGKSLREAVDSSERLPPPRAMIVKLSSYGTRIKAMRARHGLRGKNIYINEHLTKFNHDFRLQFKKDCPEGVAVYTVDECVLARCASLRKVYRIARYDDLKSYGLNKKVPNTVQDADTA